MGKKTIDNILTTPQPASSEPAKAEPSVLTYKTANGVIHRKFRSNDD